MYKLSPLRWGYTEPTSVIDLDKMCAIPYDPANTDYANFKAQINADEAQLEDADEVVMTSEQAKEYVATLP
jgi:hypothetical protein